MSQQTTLQALRAVLSEEEQAALQATQLALERARLDLERARMTAEDYAGGSALFRPGYSWRDANNTLQRIVRESNDRIDRTLDVGYSGRTADSPSPLTSDEQVDAMMGILEGDD